MYKWRSYHKHHHTKIVAAALVALSVCALAAFLYQEHRTNLMTTESRYDINGYAYEFSFDQATQELAIELDQNGNKEKIQGIPDHVASWTPPYQREGTNDPSTYITFWIDANTPEIYVIESATAWRPLTAAETAALFPPER